MIDLRHFIGVRLCNGFVIQDIKITGESLIDALDREAIAQTRILGHEFRLLIKAGLSQEELSVTLYHEILEGAAGGSMNPPDSLMDFNEASFEQAARAAHERWGDASPDNLNRLL